jgi:large subunit GTPase 1
MHGQSIANAKKKTAMAARAKYYSLIRNASNMVADTDAHVDNTGKKLKSIWESSNMDSFLTIADERENGFLAERNVQVVVSGAVHIVKNDRIVPHTDDRDWFKLSEELKIPKRPEWDYELPPAELERREKSMFLEWRRSLAHLEESHKVLLTPYEKNLEVWRQLWRVVERSDILLEIVDSRNPLAFRSVDFERYVACAKNAHGVEKPVALLLNKADLLTENQRKAWSSYLQSRGIRFYFFSAKPLERPADHTQKEEESSDDEDYVPTQIERDLKKLEDGSDEEESEDDGLDTDEEDRIARMQKNKKDKPRHQRRKLRGAPVQYVNPYELEALRKQQKADKNAPPPPKAVRPETREERERSARIAERIALHKLHDVLSPEDLLDHLATFRAQMHIKDPGTPLVVGMVGYPNVGKSSTINAILGCKKVVVSATPGKTKHFQTLVIPNERRVMLCDCPGLVFPSFASTRQQMICDGVLPIDTVKDYVAPIAVVCQRIPRQIFEDFFKVALLPEFDVDDSTSIADRLLNIVARRRGYMTDHDKPNRSKSAKEILKMYVDGVFVFAHPPPGLALTVPDEFVVHEKPAGDDEDEWEDDEDDEEDAEEGDDWEDISSADEARALSQDGHSDGDTDDEAAADPPMFFSRPRGQLTQSELFNMEHNVTMMNAPQKVTHRKKKTNHQLEPDLGVIIHEDGEVELAIDSDDGIVAYKENALPKHMLRPQEKTKSKRKQRREAKRLGTNAPTNPTSRVVALESK